MTESNRTADTAAATAADAAPDKGSSQRRFVKLSNALRVRGDALEGLREKRALWLMMILGIIFSGVAFSYKIAEFVAALSSEDAKGFADVPVTTYFFVAAGWLFIMFWCFITGRFSDTESAKYDMLRMEEEYERQGQ